jgi:hypothetical protein
MLSYGTSVITYLYLRQVSSKKPVYYLTKQFKIITNSDRAASRKTSSLMPRSIAAQKKEPVVAPSIWGGLVICLFLFSPLASAQDSDDVIKRQCLFKTSTIDLLTQELKQSKPSLREKSSDLAIPVVFHIIGSSRAPFISDEQVISQLDRINKDFSGNNADIINVPVEFSSFVSNADIKFCLASKDPVGERTSGILRRWSNIEGIGLDSTLFRTLEGGSDAWDPDRYLNVWVAAFGENVGLIGFATSPGEEVPEDEQGVVLNPLMFLGSDDEQFSMGRTAVHEIGHFLGLEHLWGDGGCESSDFVDDTPLQDREYYGCPTYPQMSCESEDMAMNFMDYVDDECMLFFTIGQKRRMFSALELFRQSLLQPCEICHEDLNVNDLEDESFLIYPNPTNGDNIQIKFSEQSQEEPVLRLVELYTPIGEKKYSKQHFIYPEIQIDFNLNLSSGTYFVSLGNEVHKLIVINQ